MELLKTNKGGWAGWYGELFRVKGKGTPEEIDAALQQQAKALCIGVAIEDSEHSLHGWGYTDERYKDGPYFYPFYIQSDTYRNNRIGKLLEKLKLKKREYMEDSFATAMRVYKTASILDIVDHAAAYNEFDAFMDNWMEMQEGSAYVVQAFFDMIDKIYPRIETRVQVPDLVRIAEIEAAKAARKKLPLPLP